MNIPIMFCFNWTQWFFGEDWNVKVFRRQSHSDDISSCGPLIQLTLALRMRITRMDLCPGELKTCWLITLTGIFINFCVFAPTIILFILCLICGNSSNDGGFISTLAYFHIIPPRVLVKSNVAEIRKKTLLMLGISIH